MFATLRALFLIFLTFCPVLIYVMFFESLGYLFDVFMTFSPLMLYVAIVLLFGKDEPAAATAPEKSKKSRLFDNDDSWSNDFAFRHFPGNDYYTGDD